MLQRVLDADRDAADMTPNLPRFAAPQTLRHILEALPNFVDGLLHDFDLMLRRGELARDELLSVEHLVLVRVK